MTGLEAHGAVQSRTYSTCDWIANAARFSLESFFSVAKAGSKAFTPVRAFTYGVVDETFGMVLSFANRQFCLSSPVRSSHLSREMTVLLSMFETTLEMVTFIPGRACLGIFRLYWVRHTFDVFRA